jgi:transcriptional regulator with XRE-family HTH domain
MISTNLRTLRMRRGWRQQDLAVAAGWSRATVSAIEAGEKRLTVRDAAALCRVLRVPLAALVDGADEADALGLPHHHA